MLNCATKICRFVVLGLLLLVPGRGLAKSKVPLQWEQFASQFLIYNEVVPVDRSWLRMQAGESTLLSYDAGLKTERPIPVECRWFAFKSKHKDLGIGPLTSEYLHQCEKSLRIDSWGWAENYYRTMFLRIKVSEHPYFKKVLLQLPNGFQQPGLLALKDSETKRPLIIFRAGIFGNSIDIQADRFLIMQLFEQGPFNLLFLDSATSPETLRWNVKYSAGGLDEGLQNYQIAERLTRKTEPLSKVIDGVHLLGLSMGGHSLWMSLALAQENKPVFRSAVGICPLVQFEKSFRSHQEHPVSFYFMNLWASLRLGVLRDRIPDLSTGHFLLESFESVAKNFKGPVTFEGGIDFPKVDGFNKDDYFAGNNLAPLLKTLRTPVTVFSTEKDSLVPFDLNFQFLKTETEKLPSFSLNFLPEGYHCSFPGAYDWDQFSAMLKDQYLEREPDLLKRSHKVVQSLPLMESELPEDPLLSFAVPVGGKELEVHLLSRSGLSIFTRIPIEKLDFATAEWVRSETEARALIRWARANIRIQVDPSPQLVWYNLKEAL